MSLVVEKEARVQATDKLGVVDGRARFANERQAVRSMVGGKLWIVCLEVVFPCPGVL